MRRDPKYVVEYLADPQRFTPGTSMPAYGEMPAHQRQAIAEFIVSLAASRRETP
jgi:hypothetical protein